MNTLKRIFLFVACCAPLFGGTGTFLTATNTTCTVTTTLTVQYFGGENRMKCDVTVHLIGPGAGCRLMLYKAGAYFNSLMSTNSQFPLTPPDYSGTNWILGQSSVSTQIYTVVVQDNNSVVLGVIDSFVWNGTTKADTPGVGFKNLTFSLTNAGQYANTGYVFCTEQPGIAWCATSVAAGASASLTVKVMANDSQHYFAAFPDVAATQTTYGGFESRQYRNPDGSTGNYYSGLVYSGVGASGILVATQGTDADPGWSTGVFAQAGLALGQVKGTTSTDRTVVTGSAVAATNDQLATVGNSITQTVVNTSAKVESAIAQNGATVAAAIAGLGSNAGGGSDAAALGTLHDDNVAAKTTLDAIKAKLAGGDGFSQGSNLSGAQGAASAALSANPYNGARPGVGVPSVTLASGGSGVMGTVTVGGQNLTLGLGGGISGTDTLMVAARPVLLIALCIGFLRAVSRDLTVYTASLPQVSAQDTAVGPENLVPGVAQAKTWGTAAGAVLVVFGGAALLVAGVPRSSGG